LNLPFSKVFGDLKPGKDSSTMKFTMKDTLNKKLKNPQQILFQIAIYKLLMEEDNSNKKLKGLY
jgi:hypothetical protein